jgi:hypothetical protein
MAMISSTVASPALARRTRLPHGPWFAVALVIALAEAFLEARAIARIARQRYPFVDW